MKRLFLFALLGTLLATTVSCDKIEKDQYLIPSGVSGEWFESHASIPKVQRAMVEKYTGVRCVNCPAADEIIHAALEQYNGKLIAVAIHSGVFGRPLGNDPDLRTEDGTQWYETLVGTSTGLPAALVNRGELFNPLGGVNDRIDPIVNNDPKVTMLITSESVVDNEFFSDIHVGFEQDIAEELTLTLLLYEDNIHTTQSIAGGGDIEDYVQNHVLRKVYTDIWGLPVSVARTQGKQYFIRLNLSLPAGCVKDNCHLVAFIAEKESHKILNVAECKL